MLTTTFETLAHGPGPGRGLRVARLGSGPPLVLLHGYPENLQLFARLAARLAGRFEVIAFDWPGMGESPAWPGGASPHQMAERLIAVLDHVGAERAHVVGHDMGGQPALVAAAEWPARVRSLVVLNSLVLWDEATSIEIRLLRRLGWNRLVLRHLPRAVFARALRTSLPRGTRLDPQVRADLWRCFRRPEVRAFVSRMCAGYQGALPKLPRRYERVGAPTLVLWGERDRHFPPVHGERLAGLVPGARFELVRAGEHWMAWDRAEEVAERVGAFCSAR